MAHPVRDVPAAIKRSELLVHTATWMQLQRMMLSVCVGGAGAGIRPIPKYYVPFRHEVTAAWECRKAGQWLRPEEAVEAARSEWAQKSAP